MQIVVIILNFNGILGEALIPNLLHFFHFSASFSSSRVSGTKFYGFSTTKLYMKIIDISDISTGTIYGTGTGIHFEILQLYQQYMSKD